MQQAGDQEPLLDPPPPLAAELVREARLLEQPGDRGGELLDAVGEPAADAVLELARDPARSPGDDRRALPEGLRDDQAEALADALLHRHVGHPLQRVHLVRRDAHLVGEQEAVLLSARRLLQLPVDAPGLRVVAGHRADHRQLQAGEVGPKRAPDLEHPERVLPGVEARDLDHQGPTHDTSSTSYYGETNVTTYSEAMWQAYFLSSSRYVIDEGSEGSMTYTIPMVYADMDPQDVLQPVLFKYIQDFSFADGDFTDTTGNAPIYTGINEHHISAITNVSQNYPNPFNKTSNVVVTLKTNSTLSLIVTNMIGQKVMQMDKGRVNAGSYTFTIDAGNLPNGVYFYSVMAGKDKTTNKMIVE